MDSDQWQIAAQFKRATDADPRSQSPVIPLQSKPPLNPHTRFGRRRFAAEAEADAAGLGLAAAGCQIRPGNILVFYDEHKRKREPLLLATNGDKREEEGGRGRHVRAGAAEAAHARARPFLARLAFCSTREDCRSSLRQIWSFSLLRGLFSSH